MYDTSFFSVFLDVSRKKSQLAPKKLLEVAENVLFGRRGVARTPNRKSKKLKCRSITNILRYAHEFLHNLSSTFRVDQKFVPGGRTFILLTVENPST